MSLSVILPAFHEGDNLNVLLPKINEVLVKLVDEYEIIVVDAMECTDSTKSEAIANNSIYLNREINDYYGSAVRTGIKYASKDKILFMDSDGSHSPKYIEDLFLYSNDYDIVIASRYINTGKTENNIILVFVSLLLNLVYSTLFNLKVKDLSNSFKLYNRKDLLSIDLRCNNFDIIEEILIKIILRNPETKIKEVPIIFKKRMYGQSKRSFVVFVFSYILTLIRLIRYKIYFERDKLQ